MRMWQAILTTVLVLLPVRAVGQDVADVIDRVWSHLGGKTVFEEARYVQFTWAVERDGDIVASRRHLWDRVTGDYVLESKDPKTGDAMVMYFNIHSRDGVAFKNGEPTSEEEGRR